MTNKDILFIDHVTKLRTKENTIMIEAVLEGFNHFITSVKVLTENHEPLMPDDELVKLTDEDAKEYVEKISAALLKMKVSDDEVRKYLAMVHNRLFKSRLALQGRQ